jgi:hypothetical protein
MPRAFFNSVAHTAMIVDCMMHEPRACCSLHPASRLDVLQPEVLRVADHIDCKHNATECFTHILVGAPPPWLNIVELSALLLHVVSIIDTAGGTETQWGFCVFWKVGVREQG